MEGFAMGYYRLCTWIMRIAYVNLLWIGFSMLGLGIVGFFPATVAMFVVVRKLMTSDKDVPIFKTFWNAFKTDFVKSNLLGYGIALVGVILYIDLRYVQAQSGLLFTILNLIILVLIFIYLIALLYIFPIYVHFQLSVKDYVKWSVVIGLVHPIMTVVMAIGVVAAYYITFMLVPGLMLFFGGSTIAFIMTWVASQMFGKFELQENYN